MNTSELIDHLRSRITPAYRDVVGTASHDRWLCVEALERLRAEIADRNSLICDLQNNLRNYREREKTMGWAQD